MKSAGGDSKSTVGQDKLISTTPKDKDMEMRSKYKSLDSQRFLDKDTKTDLIKDLPKLDISKAQPPSVKPIEELSTKKGVQKRLANIYLPYLIDLFRV